MNQPLVRIILRWGSVLLVLPPFGLLISIMLFPPHPVALAGSANGMKILAVSAFLLTLPIGVWINWRWGLMFSRAVAFLLFLATARLISEMVVFHGYNISLELMLTAFLALLYLSWVVVSFLRKPIPISK